MVILSPTSNWPEGFARFHDAMRPFSNTLVTRSSTPRCSSTSMPNISPLGVRSTETVKHFVPARSPLHPLSAGEALRSTEPRSCCLGTSTSRSCILRASILPCSACCCISEELMARPSVKASCLEHPCRTSWPLAGLSAVQPPMESTGCPSRNGGTSDNDRVAAISLLLQALLWSCLCCRARPSSSSTSKANSALARASSRSRTPQAVFILTLSPKQFLALVCRRPGVMAALGFWGAALSHLTSLFGGSLAKAWAFSRGGEDERVFFRGSECTVAVCEGPASGNS
mmetsp:Transcript_113648/g.316506  ORF Transcript_113648/g.316506 Transcript_113648/m.316506 type:complete len:285 (-) Transcript_113648:448-1302(-)